MLKWLRCQRDDLRKEMLHLSKQSPFITVSLTHTSHLQQVAKGQTHTDLHRPEKRLRREHKDF